MLVDTREREVFFVLSHDRQILPPGGQVNNKRFFSNDKRKNNNERRIFFKVIRLKKVYEVIIFFKINKTKNNYIE